MAAVRSCVCLLVVLVHLQVAVGKPFLDWLLCDMVCTDDDITASTASTTETDMFDDLFSFDCSDCPTRATTARPAQSISLRLPGAPNGLSMNVTDNNGAIQFVLDAVAVAAAAAGNGTPAAAAPAAPNAAPPAAAPPAAPAGNATASG